MSKQGSSLRTLGIHVGPENLWMLADSDGSISVFWNITFLGLAIPSGGIHMPRKAMKGRLEPTPCLHMSRLLSFWVSLLSLPCWKRSTPKETAPNQGRLQAAGVERNWSAESTQLELRAVRSLWGQPEAMGWTGKMC